MKPLTPRNLWNYETIDTTKPMKLWNHWHHETYKTMKSLTPGNLWNHETIDTTKPMKPRNHWHHETYETIDTTKPMIWHRHWHILISINSCTVTPSYNPYFYPLKSFCLFGFSNWKSSDPKIIGIKTYLFEISARKRAPENSRWPF